MALSTREMLLILRARDEMSRVLRGVATGFGNVDAASMRASRNMMAAGAGFISLGAGITAAGVAGLNFLQQATEAATEFEKQIALASTVVDDKFTVSMEQMGATTKRVAKEVAQPIEDINETLFFIFSSMDVGIKDAETLLRGFAKEAVAGNTDIQASARSTIAIMNGFSLSVKDLGRIQDVQFRIVDEGILTYEELSATIGLSISAANRANQTFETLGAMMAFLTRRGLSASRSSTSAARALEAISNPKTVTRLKAMGIAVETATGEFRPLKEIVVDLQKELADLPTPERTEAIHNLFKGAGSTIQARRFWEQVLKSNDQVVQFVDLVDKMNNASGQFEDAYGKMADTTASKSQILANQWQIIKIEIGQALLPVINFLVDALGKLLAAWDRLTPAQKQTVGTILAIAAAGAVVIGSITAVAGIFLMLAGAAAALGVSLGGIAAVVTIVVGAVVAIGAALIHAWRSSEKFRNGVKQLGEFFASFWPIIVDLFNRFKEVAGPALQKISTVLGEEVIPAINQFLEVIRPVLVWLIQTIGGALIGAFQGAMTFIQGALQIISGILNFFSALFTGNWSALWEAVKQIGEGIWNAIKGAFQVFINLGLVKVIKIGFNLIKGIVMGVWNFIKGIFVGGFNFVKNIVMGGINAVVGFFRALPGRVLGAIQSLISSIWNWAKGVASKALQGIKDGFTAVINWFKGLPGKILGAIGNLGNLLLQAGKNLITGLWNGIKNAWNWVKDKISGIVDWVADLWPFSPAKHGPLRKKPPEKAGASMMRLLGMGIDKGIPDVMKKMTGVAESIATTMFATGGGVNTTGQQPRTAFGVPAGALAPTGFGGGGGITQTVIVYTNEIDPRRNAAELGWALSREVS